MSKQVRETIYWLIPWCIIGILAFWKDADQQGDINTNAGNIASNMSRITAHEAVVVIDAADRFTMSNFHEWVHAFMEANPNVVCPQVDFSPPPQTVIEQK